MNKEIIVIHHSLTEDGGKKDFDAIKRWQMEHGWYDIAYHWIVEEINGVLTAIPGRPETATAGAVSEDNMNNKAIHICVVGNFDVTTPSLKLYAFIAELCKSIKSRWNTKAVEPHNKYAINKDTGKPYKSCPGKHFDMNYLRSLVFTVSPVQVKLNNKILPALVKQVNDHTYVSVSGQWIYIRDFAKVLGATVQWDDKTNSVILTM